MMLDKATQAALVAQANLAPSVHNTQPARWHFAGDGRILILADPRRFLAIGDPQARDAGLSCGAALEGTVLALAQLGYHAENIIDHWHQRKELGGYRLAASLTPHQGNASVGDAAAVCQRQTWRGAFDAASPDQMGALAAWARGQADVTLVTAQPDLAFLARLNDQVLMQFYDQHAYRHELLSWMRLTRRHPDFHRDGMNLQALRLSAPEGFAARHLLASPLLMRLLSLSGLQAAVFGEYAKTLGASGIVLFHRSKAESPIVTGRAFYRMWLGLAGLGLAVWPMAVIADDPASAALCTKRFALPSGQCLVNLLRVGVAPENRPPPRARLLPDDVIVML